MERYELTSDWQAKKPRQCYENHYKILSYVLFIAFLFAAFNGCISHSPKASNVIPVVKNK